MASLLSSILAIYLKHMRQPVFRTAEGFRAHIPKARAAEDHRPPPKIVGGLSVARREHRGMKVYELGMREAKGQLVYLHGGAFCFEITPFHWKLIVELAVGLNVRVIVPIYPLAPESQAPQVQELLMGLWSEVVESGPAVVVGDSAGGNLALVLAQQARDRGLALPSALGLISPCVDMTLRHPDIPNYAVRDPWLAIDGALEAVRLYAGPWDLADPRISPALGDLSGLPPTLIQIGTRDLLYPDAADLAKALPQGELAVGQGMVHVWPLLPIPEARPAKAQLLAFLRRHMAD